MATRKKRKRVKRYLPKGGDVLLVYNKNRTNVVNIKEFDYKRNKWVSTIGNINYIIIKSYIYDVRTHMKLKKQKKYSTSFVEIYSQK